MLPDLLGKEECTKGGGKIEPDYAFCKRAGGGENTSGAGGNQGDQDNKQGNGSG